MCVQLTGRVIDAFSNSEADELTIADIVSEL